MTNRAVYQTVQALSSLELMGSRQRKNFLKLFRKYSKFKKNVIEWCVRSSPQALKCGWRV